MPYEQTLSGAHVEAGEKARSYSCGSESKQARLGTEIGQSMQAGSRRHRKEGLGGAHDAEGKKQAKERNSTAAWLAYLMSCVLLQALAAPLAAKKLQLLALCRAREDRDACRLTLEDETAFCPQADMEAVLLLFLLVNKINCFHFT